MHRTELTGAATSSEKSVGADAERQLQRQVAIRAEALDGQKLKLRRIRCIVSIDQRNVHLAAQITGARAELLMLARDQARRAANRIVGAMFIGSLIGQRIKRIELLVLFRARTDADDASDLINFEVERPRAVGHDVVLRLAIIDMNGIGAFGKQIEAGVQ